MNEQLPSLLKLLLKFFLHSPQTRPSFQTFLSPCSETEEEVEQNICINCIGILDAGADPRMAGAVQSSQQPMPFPQPGAFPGAPAASQLPQPAQWPPNQLPPNHQQQQQQQPQQFMQQPGHFGEPQFVLTDQPGQPFQPQQPAFQAPNQVCICQDSGGSQHMNRRQPPVYAPV